MGRPGKKTQQALPSKNLNVDARVKDLQRLCIVATWYCYVYVSQLSYMIVLIGFSIFAKDVLVVFIVGSILPANVDDNGASKLMSNVSFAERPNLRQMRRLHAVSIHRATKIG